MARPTPPISTDLRTRAAYAEAAGIHRIVPQGVSIPQGEDDVRAVVDWAVRTATPLVPRGAGSAMPGSAVGPGVIVDMTQGFRNIEIDAGRRRIITGAGVTWGALSEAAAPHQLRLPPDPSSGRFATVGGMVATNAAGPRSLAAGSVRRWIEAIRVVGAEGRAGWIRRGAGGGSRFAPDAEALRRAVARFPLTTKNSSGYALDALLASGDELDLFIGAEGTLGLVTAVEWRLEAAPAARAGVAIGVPTLDALQEAVSFLRTLRPSAIELMDETLLAFVRDAGGTIPQSAVALLLIEFERPTSQAARGAVGDAVRGLRHLTSHVATAPDAAALRGLWEVRAIASSALARLPVERRSLQVIEDACVPLEHLGAYLAGVRAAAREQDVPVALFGHAGDAHVHVNTLPDVTRPNWEVALRALFDEVTALVIRLGGTPAGEHGDGRLRAGVIERVYGPESVALFAQLRRAYDPAGIFNPGVILPASDWQPLGALKVGATAVPIPDDIAARLRDMERRGGWATLKTELAR